MKSIVTEYDGICIFCGRRSEGEHHLLFGTSRRDLAERDGLKVPVCNQCHNMGEALRRIHGNPMAEKLSKMLGQAVWEENWILASADPDRNEAREQFRIRYGKSYM